jgi:hypothetical protein
VAISPVRTPPTLVVQEIAEAEEAMLRHGMPIGSGVIGSLDGTYVRVFKSTDLDNDVQRIFYSGRRKCHAYNVVAAADGDGLFTFIDPRHPGGSV